MVKTVLSVNLNKIALLRNSRGRNFPSVLEFAKRTLDLGVKGITIHPRPDERHIRRKDAQDLATLVAEYKGAELNIEGNPNQTFIQLIEQTQPHQVTLVPDDDQQITSDHGWDLKNNFDTLQNVCDRLRQSAGRVAVFVDPGVDIAPLVDVCDRIELYTEAYAQAFAAAPNRGDTNAVQSVLASYKATLAQAVALGIGVNAGHDLDLHNLPHFLTLGSILEVSIGHALTVEALQLGWDTVIKRYMAICAENSIA